jgi:hypothetical protein
MAFHSNRRRGANIMKRVRTVAIAMGVLVNVGLLSVQRGYADENDRATKCTLATLKGRYLFAGTSTTVPSAGEEETLSASAGYHIFRGDGTGTDFVTLVVNGHVVPVSSPTPVEYTLNSNCTGTYTILASGGTSDIFVSPNGEELALISTSPGTVHANYQRRVAPK